MIKWINGEAHKLCTGPAHDEPTWLPATDKYFYRYRPDAVRAGTLVSRCRLCAKWSKLKDPGSETGWIEARKARPFVQEAANRVGVQELAKRVDMSPEAISAILTGKTKYTQKKTLRKIMLELVSIRRKNERSISPHAAWRIVKRGNGYQGVCSRCGITLSDYTSDCETCQERKRKRKARGLTDDDV